MKKFAAELIGTLALVFAGTGAIVVNETLQSSPRCIASGALTAQPFTALNCQGSALGVRN